ncbi:substrate-binding domain-containing protein [Dactylosporangium sp. CA-233914]|uniref:substrate-binding domain-containing protein n=1 Tax=Dactylosporangium sp. CA-233914 TaxID=3239934 RepID=UPI003D8DBEB1
MAAGLALALTACGGLAASPGDESSSSAAAYTELATGSAASAADEAALQKVPASARDAYAGFWQSTRLGPNPYADWSAPKAPWQFCYSSAYQGNSWRQEGLTVAQGIVDQLTGQGLVKGKLIVSDANNNASLQATQINTMVQKGCNVIFVMQPPTVGLCNAFEGARKAGALVVVMQTGTDCTNVMQSDFGAYHAGQTSAAWLVKKTGGKGTVVMCDGIPGVAAGEARQAGAAAVFKEAGLKVDHITGQWTPSTIKSQMLQYLSTNPGDVAGVWDGGVCAVPVTEAFEQAGRNLPWITGFEGACAWLANWKKTGKDSIGFTQGAGQGVVEAFKIALRMLAGQKPEFNTLLYPLQTIDGSNVDQYYNPAMTLNSACNAQPTGGEVVPASYYDDLFKGGNQPATFTSGLDKLPVK